DKTVRLWDAKDGSLIATMKHDSEVKGALFNKDETRILSWSGDRTVRLWDAKNGSLIATMKHDSEVYDALFNRDETRILSWSEDKTVRLWNIQADYDFPKEHLPLLVEVMTGTKMDDYGNVTVLSKDEWEKRKKEYIKIAEEHLKTCKYKEANLYLKQKQLWGVN
ncbi:MAG: hypothetical protein D6828_05635, partial [Nitrospirae bacterium]